MNTDIEINKLLSEMAHSQYAFMTTKHLAKYANHQLISAAGIPYESTRLIGNTSTSASILKILKRHY